MRQTTTKHLDNYQWAWEFARRGEDYNAFYPLCKKAFDEDKVAFKNSEYHDRLHNEFGLNFLIDPATPGKDVYQMIWDFSFCLQGVIIEDKNLNEALQIPVVLDLRLPREYQLEALDRLLREKDCVEAVKKRQPGKFQDFLNCYDTRKRLRAELEREPSHFEIASQVWPHLVGGPMTDKELADKVRYPLKMADHYINDKGYLEILRWKPPAKK